MNGTKTLCDLNESLKSAEDDQGDDDANDRSNETRNTKAFSGCYNRTCVNTSCGNETVHDSDGPCKA